LRLSSGKVGGAALRATDSHLGESAADVGRRDRLDQQRRHDCGGAF